MNAAQVDQLVATVPGSIEPRQRRRLDGYANAARRCDERIAVLRERLAAALMASGEDSEAADDVLDTMVELEALERVQLRVDAGLRASVGALAEPVTAAAMLGEGPA